jgi:hypothetical protein
LIRLINPSQRFFSSKNWEGAMPAQPDGMNAKVAVESAGLEGRDRDLVVDVARGFERQSKGEETSGTVPLSLAGKGRASNIQNELGEEIRSSKFEIRSTKFEEQGARRRAAGGNRRGGRKITDDGGLRELTCVPARSAVLRRHLASGGGRIPTRNGRIRSSFGNSIVACADHSSREGLRRRMPDFYPPSVKLNLDRQVANMSFHLSPVQNMPASKRPWAESRQEEWGISLWERKKAQESAMGEEPRENTKTQVALVIAQGVPIAAWARTIGVPRRTVFQWTKDGSSRRSGVLGAARSIWRLAG